MHDIQSFRPYQRFLTLTLLGTFILVGIIGSFTVYLVRSRSLFHATQTELKLIAQNAARGVPIALHETIRTPEDEQGEAFVEVIERFSAMRLGNPNIDDIYTLRPTSKNNVFTFVVSSQETADLNGDGTIDQAEVRPAIGEEYDATAFPRLQEGLVRPSADDTVTIDKWGSWVSGYAPLKDETGKIVGLVGIDYSSNVIAQQRLQIIRSLVAVDLAVIPLLIIISILIARWLARPYTTLARAMYDVAHGDAHKQLPVEGGKSTRVFAELFNGMVQMIGSAKHSKDDEK